MKMQLNQAGELSVVSQPVEQFTPPLNDTSYDEVKTTWEEHGEVHTHLDWWQATIEIEHWGGYDPILGEYVPGIHNFLTWLQKKLVFCDLKYGRGGNGYTDSATFYISHDVIMCTVLFGGVNANPNIRVTGGRSQQVKDIIVSEFASGKVSRVDSAFDSLSGTTEFERAARWLEDRAKKAGINTKWIRNSDRNIGDTLYVGSQTSRVMIRLYEKGKEQRLTGAKRDLWWRAEVQLRPDTKAKQWAYSWSAGMVWGSSRITREFMAYLTGEKLVANNLQVSDMKKGLEDRAAWLVKQYGNLLKELVEETGSWAGVGVMLDRLSEARGTGRIMPKEAGEDECQS